MSYSFIGLGWLNEPFFPFRKNDQIYDLVIVGGGHAGLAAAIIAKENNLKTLVIEKKTKLGLNVHSDTGIFASSSNPEGIPNVGDSVQKHAEDIFVGGGKVADYDLILAFTKEAPVALRWLKNLGMEFEKEPFDSNSLYPRCFKPVHLGYMEVLQREAMRVGVEFAYGETAEEILIDQESISGVLVEDINKKKKRYRCHQLLLASGGFSANKELVKKNVLFAQVGVNTKVGSDGKMMLSAAAIGAQLVGMDRILCKPRPDDIYSQGYLHINVARVIYVNVKGKRFISEDAYRKDILLAFLKQLPDYVYEITDNGAVRSFSMDIQKDLWRGLERGNAYKADSVDALARMMGIEPQQLIKTVESYNHSVLLGIDNEFGKQKINLSHQILEAPFWGVKVKMVVHESTGGLKVDDMCRVLDSEDKPITGLLAAGAIVGNLHGENRLGGNGIGSAICLGRIAGRTASAG